MKNQIKEITPEQKKVYAAIFWRILEIVLLILCLRNGREIFFNKETGHFIYSHAVQLGLLWILAHTLMLQKFSFSDRTDRLLSWLIFVLSPFYIFLTMEAVTATPDSANSRIQNLIGTAATRPDKALVNVLLIALLVIALTGLTNSLTKGPGIALLICAAFAIINLYVDDFRGNALSAADFLSLRTALTVSDGYAWRLYFRPFLGITLVILFWAVALKPAKSTLFPSLPGHAVAAVLGLVVLAIGTKALVLSPFLPDHGFEISYFNTIRSYRKFGTAATLARSVSEAKPAAPEGYSADAYLALTEKYPGDEPAGEPALSETHPNVIVVMLESFADLEQTYGFTPESDPLPFWHSLQENCLKGTVYVPTYGGMTANSEYEFLTGDSMGFLPPASVPFQLYIRSETPSAASWFSEQGYGGITALHPFTPANYRRDEVYPLLGFKEFYSRDNMPLKLKNLRKYPDDSSDVDNLIALYEEAHEQAGEAPVFLYNLTVQNHSGYDKKYKNLDVTEYTAGLSRTYKDVNQYLSLLRHTDDAIKKLIGYFESISEPTMILLLGDHQPKLSTGFYQEITHGADLWADPEKSLAYYQVPYAIWTNYEWDARALGEKIRTTSMNYMQVNLLEASGGLMNGYEKFLLALRDEVPVMTPLGYYAKDGRFYETDDKASPWYERIQEYAIWQYGMSQRDRFLDS